MLSVATRVFAIDDHPVVVEGILALVARQAPELEIVGTASTWGDAVTALDGLSAPPDVVMLDLHLGDGSDPAESITALRRRGAAVVLLTSEVRPVPIRRAMKAGALGLALKSDPIDHVVSVVRTAAAGEPSVSSDLAFVLVTDPELTVSLAPREIEVLALLADGVPRKSVGALMRPPVTMATVVTYLNRACARYREAGIDVRSPGDALRAAIADGHIELPEQRRATRHTE